MSSTLVERIRSLDPWFHNLVLDGVETAPDHVLGDYPRQKWQVFSSALPSSLEGCTVLDVGCNAGFYSFEMARRGAERVVAMDFDPRYLAQARLAADVLGFRGIEFVQLSAYDVKDLGETFDVVLFMGVLYHLRHPLLALDLLRDHVVSDLLVFQSMMRGYDVVAEVAEDHPFEEQNVFDEPGYPRLHFVEHRYAGDPTNWWVPNRACVEAMLRSAGFRIERRPDDDVYLCRIDDRARP